MSYLSPNPIKVSILPELITEPLLHGARSDQQEPHTKLYMCIKYNTEVQGQGNEATCHRMIHVHVPQAHVYSSKLHSRTLIQEVGKVIRVKNCQRTASPCKLTYTIIT